MEDLKSLAFKRIVQELLKTCGLNRPLSPLDLYDCRLRTKTVYDNTPNLYPPPDLQRPTESTGNRSSTLSPVDELPPKPSDNLFGDEIAQPHSPREPKPEHHSKIRVLIARYAASALSHLRLDADFKELMRTRGEFAEDLINAAMDGAPLTLKDLQDI